MIDPANLPQDLRLPSGFVMASIDHQIRVAVDDLRAYVAKNEPRLRYEHGRNALHPMTYAAEVQARKSIVHTLLAIKARIPATEGA